MNRAFGRAAAAARARFHPLHAARRVPLVRQVVAALDRPVWARVDGAAWPVRLRRLRHLAYRSSASTPDPDVGHALLGLLDALEADGAFLDVGANFGYYSWLLKSRRPELAVLMVEPDPDNQQLVAATIERNELTRVELVRGAASDTSGTVAFARDLRTGARGGIGRDADAGASIDVITRPLDELVAGRRVALIKIDVEGHEHEALRGGRELLRRDRPFVVFECECPLHGDDPTLEEQGFVVLDAATLRPKTPQSRNFVACARDRLGALESLRAALAPTPGAP